MKIVTKVVTLNATNIRLSGPTANKDKKKGTKTQMSGITLDSEKSKLPDASKDECAARIMKTAEYWFETANDEYGFGVIQGLRIALDILEGK